MGHTVFYVVWNIQWTTLVSGKSCPLRHITDRKQQQAHRLATKTSRAAFYQNATFFQFIYNLFFVLGILKLSWSCFFSLFFLSSILSFFLPKFLKYFCEALRSALRLPSLFRQFPQTTKQYALNVGWCHWHKESNFCWILHSSLSIVEFFPCKST